VAKGSDDVPALVTTRFLSDATTLLTADQKGLRLWDVATCEPLTMLHPHPMQSSLGVDADGARPTFVDNENYVIYGSSSQAARLWPLSIPRKRTPQWFTDFVESMVMQRIENSESLPVTVPPQSYLKLRDEILNMPPNDEYVRWAQQWFAPLNK
jgi:WD40 repeat protein